jgi:NADH dehydrogenase
MTAAPASPGHGAPDRGGVVAVLGATGFLGRRVVRRLLDRGFAVRACARRPERVPPLLGPEAATRVEVVRADAHDGASIAAALAGAHGAVNAVGLYVERGGRETFRAVHVEAAARVARLAREAGVARLVHVSGIGADPASRARYVRARGEGEIAVRAAFPGATLVRPSVMFGSDDRFLTTLARLLRTLPVYPLFGRGGTRLQPVWVEDVAEAIARILTGADGAGHPCYELGGPRTYAYAELLRSVADRVGARARLVPLPFAAWEVVARLSAVALMRRDNVASPGLPGLPELHVAPTALEDVLPVVVAGEGGARR